MNFDDIKNVPYWPANHFAFSGDVNFNNVVLQTNMCRRPTRHWSETLAFGTWGMGLLVCEHHSTRA